LEFAHRYLNVGALDDTDVRIASLADESFFNLKRLHASPTNDDPPAINIVGFEFTVTAHFDAGKVVGV